MRLSPTLAETRFSLSFFLTTPTKKPRTECCCQSVAFMIAAIVVPFGCRNIPRTVSCFDEALDLTDKFLGVDFLDAAVDWVALRFPSDELLLSDRFVVRFLDFDLLVAILALPCVSDSILCCH
jgi:hypothetical protein